MLFARPQWPLINRRPVPLGQYQIIHFGDKYQRTSIWVVAYMNLWRLIVVVVYIHSWAVQYDVSCVWRLQIRRYNDLLYDVSCVWRLQILRYNDLLYDVSCVWRLQILRYDDLLYDVSLCVTAADPALRRPAVWREFVCDGCRSCVTTICCMTWVVCDGCRSCVTTTCCMTWVVCDGCRSCVTTICCMTWVVCDGCRSCVTTICCMRSANSWLHWSEASRVLWWCPVIWKKSFSVSMMLVYLPHGRRFAWYHVTCRCETKRKLVVFWTHV